MFVVVFVAAWNGRGNGAQITPLPGSSANSRFFICAVDYQIDVSTDGATWEVGVDSMPLTLFYIYWKKPKGSYFIRLCPRDKDGKRGTPSNQLPIVIY